MLPQFLAAHSLSSPESEPESTPTAETAALRISVPVGQIAKSMLFKGRVTREQNSWIRLSRPAGSAFYIAQNTFHNRKIIFDNFYNFRYISGREESLPVTAKMRVSFSSVPPVPENTARRNCSI
jgi:hypothetical protein